MLFHMAKTEKFNMLRMMINMLRKIHKIFFVDFFKLFHVAKTENLFSAPTGSNCTFHFPLFKKLIFQLFKTRLAKIEKFISARKGVKSAHDFFSQFFSYYVGNGACS